MKLEIPEEHLNELQRRSILKLLADVKGMHYADIQVRKGGRDHQYEADWLRHLRLAEPSPAGERGQVGWMGEEHDR